MKNSQNTLSDIYSNYSGHVSDKWDIYLHVYDRTLSEFRDQAVNLLEIGVQNGGSLQIWSDFFLNAKNILGCDVNPDCKQIIYTNQKIKLVIGDINTTETAEKIFSYSPELDIIIDDGSHTSSDIINSFVRYFPRLSYGGIYIIEDLHCSYWREFEGGLNCAASSMNFLKKLVDVINYEHWGLPISKVDYLKEFFISSGSLEDRVLADIHSIEFVNSLCIVTKRPPSENVLGIRHVVGTEALVVRNQDFNGTYSKALAQESIMTDAQDKDSIIDALKLEIDALKSKLQEA